MGKTKKKAAAAPASEPAVLKAPTKVSASADASKAQREVSAKAKKVKVPAAPAVQPDSADKKRKKAEADEIDAIFSDRKKKKAQDAAAAAKEAAELPDGSAKKGTQSAKVEGSKDDIFGEDVGKKRKKTEEGWNIYTEDELGLGRKGGDTDLCPFDCDCCF